MIIIELTEKDTRPLVCQYQAGGAVIDITGYTFTIKIGYTTPLAKQAVITDAINGGYEFQWLDTDLTSGTFDAEIMVTNPAGQEETSVLFTTLIKARNA